MDDSERELFFRIELREEFYRKPNGKIYGMKIFWYEFGDDFGEYQEHHAYKSVPDDLIEPESYDGEEHYFGYRVLKTSIDLDPGNALRAARFGKPSDSVNRRKHQ